MNQEKINQLLLIISKSNDVTVSFNVPYKNNNSKVHCVLIRKANATLIESLVRAGFSLFMTEEGLSVDYI